MEVENTHEAPPDAYMSSSDDLYCQPGGFNVDLQQQSVPVNGDDGGAARRYAATPSSLIAPKGEGPWTLFENFRRTTARVGGKQFLGTRAFNTDGTRGPYEWQTYDQVWERMTNLGSSLVELGLEEKAALGLYSLNRAEWVIGELACYAFNLVTVALYDTLGPNACTFIINHSELTAVLCSKDKVSILLQSKRECPRLKYIISMDPVADEEVKRAADSGVTLLVLETLEEQGKENPHPYRPPQEEDLCAILYTSGTTGNPKGPMLTHRNFVSNVWGAHFHATNTNEADIHFSYLPLAHSFERLVAAAFITYGGRIGFFQGDVTKLMDDVATLRPTLFIGVPRVFNRICDRITATVEASGPLRKLLFRTAYRAKLRNLHRGIASGGIWDLLVFSKTKALLGGQCRLLVSGAAPLHPDIHEMIQICFCCPVVQGYGLTETCAATTMTIPNDTGVGKVGTPLCSNEVKLVDVPEMEYLVTDTPCPQGEVCIRGNNVFKGYFKDQQLTEEALDADGWFHTGDVGRWNKDGTLTIVDRKKNIFKLAQGEYVAAEYLERVYTASKFVAQIFVHGDSLKTSLVGIVAVEGDAIKKYAKMHHIEGDLAALCANEAMIQAVMVTLDELARKERLKGFERLKAIHLDPVPFSVADGILTPTFKLNRKKARGKYEQVIREMYNKLEADTCTA